ncbi:capsule assembly Wzi family protein [Flavobacterium sp.]|uniref:capsule assembly Wzi family protein n=1 Tax=Flavobacterium sp. TaxID=239 RepID=UPI00404811D6
MVGETPSSSFLARPLSSFDSIELRNFHCFLTILEKDLTRFFSPEVKILPVNLGSQLGSGNPYPEVSKFLQAKGYQQWISAGIFGSFGPLSIQLQPEFIFAQNKDYNFGSSKANGIEYKEFFGLGSYSKLIPGQSSIRLNYGAFSLGASTENIWWGPGQYNSLLFSTNAFGFQHLTLNTSKPAKTFLGSFEGQLIMGKLENFAPFVRDGKEDWRYVNGITFSYQPKWIPELFIGASRVFQQYSSFNNNTWAYYFPLFEPFQKVKLIDPNSPDFDSTEYDDRLQSQQLTGFARLVIPKAKAEVYFEFGRRDHAVDWREFLLNPEHARAYLFGFKKLIPLSKNIFFQVNGEILQQQESINILTRYGPEGLRSWSSHRIKQGFTHLGQMLGPGIGPSSNVQTLETSWVSGLKKLGIRWERLNRHQDLYTRYFNDPSENGRWVDYSARLLADWQFDNLLVSTTTNFVYTLNNQWGLAEKNTPSFPKGKNSFMVIGQVNLIYFWGRGIKKKE